MGLTNCCRLLLLISLATSLRTQPQENTLRIHIHIYNYTDLSEKTVVDAGQAVARIFQRMDVETEWLICPVNQGQLFENRACDVPFTPSKFAVRLLSNDMAERFPLGHEFFGFALLPISGGFGVTANVFAERAKEMVGRAVPLGMILGNLVAHELGHLLLNKPTHSVAGVMCGQWRGQELQKAAGGTLVFLPEQARIIRAQVLARLSGNGVP